MGEESLYNAFTIERLTNISRIQWSYKFNGVRHSFCRSFCCMEIAFFGPWVYL